MKKTLLFTLVLLTALQSCKKFLEKAPDATLDIPTTIQGMQELMNNQKIFLNSTPGLGQLSTTDGWYTDSMAQVMNVIAQNAYTWQTDIYRDDHLPSWDDPYQAIYYCNVVLTYLPPIKASTPEEEALKGTLRGMALYGRAFHTYNLEETFGHVYRSSKVEIDKGILLRLDADPQKKAGRSTVQQVYQQMIADLQQSLPLLSDTLQYSHRNRPSKPAALALLARIYLTMQQYDSALVYADRSLYYYNYLIDYNTIDPANKRPFTQQGNDEVLFPCSAVDIPGQYAPYVLVDTNLYNSYADNDLRKTIFFRPAANGQGYYMKPGYAGTNFLFSGLATDEVYLIKAESHARLQQKQQALEILNTLLMHRYKKNTFQPLTAAKTDEALALILTERRKETLFREIRWFDLRRLNQDSQGGDTLKRRVGGQDYALPPGSLRYTFPLPASEIRLGGIEQNQR